MFNFSEARIAPTVDISNIKRILGILEEFFELEGIHGHHSEISVMLHSTIIEDLFEILDKTAVDLARRLDSVTRVEVYGCLTDKGYCWDVTLEACTTVNETREETLENILRGVLEIARLSDLSIRNTLNNYRISYSRVNISRYNIELICAGLAREFLNIRFNK